MNLPNNVDEERLSTLASEASNVIKLLLTCVRSGAKPSASLDGVAQRLSGELLAMADALDPPSPPSDEPT